MFNLVGILYVGDFSNIVFNDALNRIDRQIIIEKLETYKYINTNGILRTRDSLVKEYYYIKSLKDDNIIKQGLVVEYIVTIAGAYNNIGTHILNQLEMDKIMNIISKARRM